MNKEQIQARMNWLDMEISELRDEIYIFESEWDELRDALEILREEEDEC